MTLTKQTNETSKQTNETNKTNEKNETNKQINIGYITHDTGYGILDTRYRIQNIGHK